jgi:drug/metabolite transporter (DMT)-like permease
LIWGINIPVVKYATLQVDPLAFNATRMILSTLTLALFAWLEARRSGWSFVPFSARSVDNRRVVVFALCSGLLYPLLFMFGIDRTTAGNTALLLSSMPMWTALLSLMFLHERLRAVTWWGLMVTFLGTAVVTGAGGEVSVAAEHFRGNLLMLLAAISWAGGTVLSTPLLRGITPLQLAFWSSLLTTPIHLWITRGELPNVLSSLDSSPILAIVLYSGILSTGVAYVTWHAGVRALGGSHAAVYQNVVTLVAVLGGWIALGEPPLAAQVLGGAMVFAGLLVMRRGRVA